MIGYKYFYSKKYFAYESAANLNFHEKKNRVSGAWRSSAHILIYTHWSWMSFAQILIYTRWSWMSSAQILIYTHWSWMS